MGRAGGKGEGRSRLAGLDDFAEMYDDHVWDVYGFIAYRVADREEAEDLTQTTFERALKAWSRFDPERSSLKTWLIAIARNLVIDHYRSDKSQMTSSLDVASRDQHERESGAADDAPSLGPDPRTRGGLEKPLSSPARGHCASLRRRSHRSPDCRAHGPLRGQRPADPLPVPPGAPRRAQEFGLGALGREGPDASQSDACDRHQGATRRRIRSDRHPGGGRPGTAV